ncbi:lipase member H-A-like [Daktulosphaira vitifoliae]|uniref:lipase member H-A-like n=1 Tax=Daktulosphaira vitifoliae TaxID=58002 RepID=UPI0021AA626E|nr:lipase member H-A-like [Daktulosphaira vitifoliae]
MTLNCSIIVVFIIVTFKVVFSQDEKTVYQCLLPLQNIDDDVSFFLHTKQYTIQLKSNQESIENAKFVNDKKIIILIHGYCRNKDAPEIKVISKAYLNGLKDYNIIYVDYSSISRFIISNHVFYGTEYVYNVIKLSHVANKISQFIELVKKVKPQIEYVHIIGHSLGAQLAGKIGKVYSRTGGIIDRITGLDPAGILFTLLPDLNRESGKFVDIIHTNIGGYGEIRQTEGAVNFIVNGGVVQPFCPTKLYPAIFFCSHSVSTYYYAHSINNVLLAKSLACTNNLIISQQIDCNKEVIFGENISLNATGNYGIQIAIDYIN